MTTRMIKACGAISVWLWLLLVITTGTKAEESSEICRYHRHGSFGIDLEGDGPRYAPDRLVDVLHIRIDVTPNFQQRTVAGVTRIEFQPISREVSELTLDAYNLEIQAVKSDVEVDDFTNDGRQLKVRFSKPIPPGQKAYLDITHAAEPRMGLYFRTPEMGYLESDTQVWTQGESHEAQHWFPCFDYPNERSSTEMICHVPTDMIVLSNGRQISESTDKDGLKRVHWLQDKPHVNYLICLVAGKFEKLEKWHGTLPLRFFVQPSLAELAENSFRDTEKIMAFFETEIGIPFPWDKYDQVTILDFVAGGMENTTLTTLTHRTLFTKATENLRQSRRLDAHELAHQWFGDLLTCKDWSHLWLNEGFATYYTHLYEGHKFGHDAMLYGLYRDAKNSILPRQNDTKPVVYRKYKNPGEQFDYRAYPKGSWVLHMLRSQLGPDLFRAAIRHYLQQHSFQSVVSDDLRQAIEDVSGRPFDRFFDQWVYHPGAPTIKVNYSWDMATKLAKVTVTQGGGKVPDGQVEVFHFPTKLRFFFENGTTVDKSIQINAARKEFFFALEAQPKVVRFDPELTVLAKIDFKKPDAHLFAQLESSDVIGRVRAAEQLSERGTKKRVQHLKRALEEDVFFGVRIAAAAALGKIGSDEAFEALNDNVRQSDARVRQEVVRQLGRFYRPDTVDTLIKVIKTDSNPDIQSSAIRALGKFQSPRVNRLLKEQLHTKSFRHSLASAAVGAIDAQRNGKHRGALRRALREDHKSFTSRGLASALQTLARISREKRDKTDTRMLIESFLSDPRSTVKAGAIRALGELGDPSSQAALESFKDRAVNPNVSSAAESALNKIVESTPSAPREVTELRKNLRELEAQHEKLKTSLEKLDGQVKAMRTSTDELAPSDKENPDTDEPPSDDASE